MNPQYDMCRIFMFNSVEIRYNQNYIDLSSVYTALSLPQESLEAYLNFLSIHSRKDGAKAYYYIDDYRNGQKTKVLWLHTNYLEHISDIDNTPEKYFSKKLLAHLSEKPAIEKISDDSQGRLMVTAVWLPHELVYKFVRECIPALFEGREYVPAPDVYNAYLNWLKDQSEGQVEDIKPLGKIQFGQTVQYLFKKKYNRVNGISKNCYYLNKKTFDRFMIDKKFVWR